MTDDQALTMEEAGDLCAALQNGTITPQDLYAELGDVINGGKAGRTSRQELTLFKSMGLGLQDVAVAAFLFERALDTRTGAMVDLEGTALASAVAPYFMKLAENEG